MKIINFATIQDLISYASSQIQLINLQKESINIAISGGKTPFIMFDNWKQNNVLDYSKTRIWQVDERYVEKDSELSNSGQTLRLFDNSDFENVFEVVNTSLDYGECIDDYDQRLNQLIVEKNTLDIVFLGFGTDGHFASIFPLDNTKFGEQLAIGTMAKDPYPVEKRITMTPECINKADKIIVILTGSDKQRVLSEFLNGQLVNSQFPCKIWNDHPMVEILTFFG
jgi:6-phosphogluconolactonase